MMVAQCFSTSNNELRTSNPGISLKKALKSLTAKAILIIIKFHFHWKN